ncbi:MAG TPA: cytochrome c biogenesis CcdA family protein [Patescibacteria group bacterium]|nr:cytochrome c biogenesis CcdA family protein [Patescibacteria group bacterium]
MNSIFFLAIAAGSLTILAPCILPLLPFLLGTSGGKSRLRPLMIIAGFVGSFSVLGAAFATAGTFLGVSNAALRNVAVVLLLLFGLALLFERTYEKAMARLQPILARWSAKLSGKAAARTDAWSGVVVGVSLGLVWTPCAGPILGSILTLASRTADYVTTLLLMFAYALGAGAPMLAIAYGGNALQRRLLKFGSWQSALNKIFGLLVVGMAVLILTGYDLRLQAWLIRFYPSSFTGNL